MARKPASTARPPTLPRLLDLTGRRVLITGAASGIGKAAAIAAAELGASLVLTDLASLADVAEEARKIGAEVKIEAGDLAADGMIERLLAHGPVAGAVHCAGVYPRGAWREAKDRRTRFTHTLDINTRVPMELGHALLDHMSANGGGNVVMIGSAAGRAGGTSRDTSLDYSASKAAVHVIVRWLSRHGVGKGVLFNGIAPGPIRTPMTAGMPFDASQLPRKRMGEPEEIAWMAVMLLTPAAGYVSGAILDVNGGTFVA